MNAWIIFIPLLPFLAAGIIGILHFGNILTGESGEKATARISLTAISLAVCMALLMLAVQPAEQGYNYGDWLNSGKLNIAFKLTSQPFNLALASLFATLLLIVMRFSVNYLHRESGFQRFFFILNLFAAAMMLLVLSGNALFTFVGWELAGVCSYWLIAYAYDRPVAAHNATRAFVTNRVGDGGFILGIALALIWLENCDWLAINNSATDLARDDATLLAVCFALAALAKSAQIPFTPC